MSVISSVLPGTEEIGQIVGGLHVQPGLNNTINLGGLAGPDVEDGPADGVGFDAVAGGHGGGEYPIDAPEPTVIGWVSGGAASAVACKLAIAKHGLAAVRLAYINTGSEHSDTERFLADLETWFGKPIERLKSAKYTDTWDVWERERFLRGPRGAKCTAVLKREVRSNEQIPAHVPQVWGFTVEEKARADTFRRHHWGEVACEFPLIDQSVTKADCYALIERAGIKLPEPYLLGFNNNNCIPCVKAEGARYWNRIRRHFPAHFERMAKLERELGYALVRIKKQPVFLDELDPEAGADDDTPEPISCGITCFIAEQNMETAA